MSVDRDGEGHAAGLDARPVVDGRADEHRVGDGTAEAVVEALAAGLQQTHLVAGLRLRVGRGEGWFGFGLGLVGDGIWAPGSGSSEGLQQAWLSRGRVGARVRVCRRPTCLTMTVHPGAAPSVIMSPRFALFCKIHRATRYITTFVLITFFI